MTGPRADAKRLGLAALVSGASCLMYQTLWMRWLSLALGSTTRSAALVTALFMAGLALGSLAASRPSGAPSLRLYALAEWGLALAALATWPLFRWFPSGLSPAARYFLSTVLLLFPTFFAGTTLPLLTRHLSRVGGDSGGAFHRLYWLNTAGACLGVLVSCYLSVPAFGLSASLLMAAAGNGLCGLLAWTSGGSQAPGPAAGEAGPPSGRGWKVLPWVAFAMGASALGLEVLWMRTFCLVLGSSIYAFNLVLASLLLGMALGTWIFGRLRFIRDTRAWLSSLLVMEGVLVLAQAAGFNLLPRLYLDWRKATPPGFGALQAGGLLLSFGALLPVTALQGFLLPLAFRLSGGSDAGWASGRLLGWNTAGAMTGALATGFGLVPVLGIQPVYAWTAAPLVAAGLGLLGQRLEWRPALRWTVPALGGLALAALAPWFRPWDPNAMTSGVYLYGVEGRQAYGGLDYLDWLKGNSRLTFYQEGSESVVSARDVPGVVKSLQVNGKTDASDQPDKVTQKLLAHLPLFLVPNARHALVVGWGSGGSAGSASLHGLDSLDCAEIEPATFRAADNFSELNFGLKPGPAFHCFFQDGRNFLRRSGGYDVIISEPSNPWISGPSNLFTREFFELARTHLNQGGIFSAWFHFYDLGEENVKREIRTFCAVFPQATLWYPNVTADKLMGSTGDLILLGSGSPQHLDLRAAEQKFKIQAVASDLESVGRRDGLSLLSDYLAGREDMLAWAGPGTLNTDDRPALEYSAPRFIDWAPEAKNRLMTSIKDQLEGLRREAAPPLEGVPGLEPSAGSGPRAEALARLGALWADRGRCPEAERVMSMAQSLGMPDSAAFWVARGRCALAGGRWQEAQAWLGKALKASSRDKEAYRLLGLAYYGAKDLQGALAAYEKMMQAFPESGEPHYLMATVMVNTGQRAAARAEIKRALEVEPNPGKKKDAEILQGWMNLNTRLVR
jgi:spermidine synthase